MMIFFDIDDTLLNSKAAHRSALTKINSAFSLKIEIDQFFDEWLAITDKYLKLYFLGELTLTQQRAIRIKELFEKAGEQITTQKAIDIYNIYHLIFLDSCKVFPDTISTLEKLKGHKLGIITNGPVHDQSFKLNNNKLIHYFNPIIISEEVNFSKPQKEIFQIAAERSTQHLADCIYIGDSYEFDFKGSLDAGMKAIWINRNSKKNTGQITTIHTLGELTEKLIALNYIS